MKLTVAPVHVDEEEEEVEEEEIEEIPTPKEPDKDIELKKEIAKEVMKKLDAATISINGASQLHVFSVRMGIAAFLRRWAKILS